MHGFGLNATTLDYVENHFQLLKKEITSDINNLSKYIITPYSIHNCSLNTFKTRDYKELLNYKLTQSN